jgi:16S rRNA A1518/A1519 N6-dimethyltransferase RsmA/KsgA/DIM1 with predicted DNA glycosylase/AP lyase activity
MMRNCLEGIFPTEEIQKHLDSLGISNDRRPETLSLEDFVSLAKLL